MSLGPTTTLYYSKVTGDSPCVMLGEYAYYLPGTKTAFTCNVTGYEGNIFSRLEIYPQNNNVDSDPRKFVLTGGNFGLSGWEFIASLELNIPSSLADRIESLANKILTHTETFGHLFKDKLDGDDEDGEITIQKNKALSALCSNNSDDDNFDFEKFEAAAEQLFDDLPEECKQENKLSEEITALKNEVGTEFHKFANENGLKLHYTDKL